ncbi:MAG: glutathione synthase [Betaproteobacteria bacterium TMED156]|nr:MAG: glutathione synthase [Betaproteobacteria bacterium TMED156]
MNLLFICDPIEKLNFSKDSTIFLIERAWERGYECRVCTIEDLSLQVNSKRTRVIAKTTLIKKFNSENIWYQEVELTTLNLNEIDIIFLRTDPPFDEKYHAATMILDVAVDQGVKIFNCPKELRNHNEKLSILKFNNYIMPTLISSNKQELIEFSKNHEKVVFKPLNEMGGNGVFVVEKTDFNIPTIIETLTEQGKNKIVGQKFIPDIIEGDKRILILNGKIVDCALARVPKKGSYIGNLAAGGNPIIKPLSELDFQIAGDVGSALAPKGFFIIGIDIIGKYLTEINVTSPTGFKEITKLTKINLGEIFYSEVSKLLGTS